MSRVPELTPALARAAAMDAGNAHSRRHGRHVWNEDDHAVATATLVRLMTAIHACDPEDG
jgi:hypothetical protein